MAVAHELVAVTESNVLVNHLAVPWAEILLAENTNDAKQAQKLMQRTREESDGQVSVQLRLDMVGELRELMYDGRTGAVQRHLRCLWQTHQAVDHWRSIESLGHDKRVKTS